ncbi:hypothetical protein [Paenibacillus sp. DMB5]|uniref:hypothetical protein n=1 Tax=Paenibacillus sp. DMB5 TaxID=1780103 RepID=UPI00076CD9C0|nr:hypothetical protein [Paenibacillus sp. DMB5]KUP25503.1 hypothetical protein AWJ19_18975 [Paenibacillus sp. DMB5]
MSTLIIVLFSFMILLNAAVLFWFTYNATAYFQRGMDIIGTSILGMAGVPLILISILFIMFIFRRRKRKGRIKYIEVVVVFLSIMFSGCLLIITNDSQWAETRVTSDAVRITTDNRYEYRLDLVNMFQRNAYARLYLKNTADEEEIYIPVDIELSDIVVISMGDEIQWSVLESTGNPSQYILSTTDDFLVPEKRFDINVESKTSIEINN